MQCGILTKRGWIMDEHVRGFAKQFPNTEAAMQFLKARGERAYRFLQPQIIPFADEAEPCRANEQ